MHETIPKKIKDLEVNFYPLDQNFNFDLRAIDTSSEFLTGFLHDPSSICLDGQFRNISKGELEKVISCCVFYSAFLTQRTRSSPPVLSEGLDHVKPRFPPHLCRTDSPGMKDVSSSKILVRFFLPFCSPLSSNPRKTRSVVCLFNLRLTEFRRLQTHSESIFLEQQLVTSLLYNNLYQCVPQEIYSIWWPIFNYQIQKENSSEKKMT